MSLFYFICLLLLILIVAMWFRVGAWFWRHSPTAGKLRDSSGNIIGGLTLDTRPKDLDGSPVNHSATRRIR